MVISHERSKVMVSGIEGPINITVNIQPLENFKYLASITCIVSSATVEFISLLSMAMSNMTKLEGF